MTARPCTTPTGPRPVFLVARFRRAAAVLLLAWPLSACTSWQSLPSPQTLFGEKVERLAVLTPAGREVTVWYPKVRGDSLFGMSARSGKDTADVRLGNLQSLKIRRFSAGRTMVLVAVVGVTATAVAAVIVAASLGDMSMDFGGMSWGSAVPAIGRPGR